MSAYCLLFQVDTCVNTIMKKQYILFFTFGFCLIVITIFVLDNWALIKIALGDLVNSQTSLNRIALAKKTSILLHWTNLMQSDLNAILPCGSIHNNQGNKLTNKTSNDSHLGENSVIIFTSFKHRTDRLTIQKNTLANWAQYRPIVQPVVFNDSTDPMLLDLAVRQGWTILSLHSKPASQAPRLKYMYMEVDRHFPNATFIGWTNADILFDIGLLKTLNFVLQFQPTFNRTLVVGGRYNLYNTNNLTIVDSDQVRHLVNNAVNKNHLKHDSEDYFFIYRNLFPWNAVVDDIVVGRPGYDNYIVGIAAMTGVSVVDASCTVGALHQMDKNGVGSGFRNNDSAFNYVRLGAFPYQQGILSKTKYYTTVNEYQTIQMNVNVKHRKPNLWRLPSKLIPPSHNNTTSKLKSNNRY